MGVRDPLSWAILTVPHEAVIKLFTYTGVILKVKWAVRSTSKFTDLAVGIKFQFSLYDPLHRLLAPWDLTAPRESNKRKRLKWKLLCNLMSQVRHHGSATFWWSLRTDFTQCYLFTRIRITRAMDHWGTPGRLAIIMHNFVFMHMFVCTCVYFLALSMKGPRIKTCQ